MIIKETDRVGVSIDPQCLYVKEKDLYGGALNSRNNSELNEANSLCDNPNTEV